MWTQAGFTVECKTNADGEQVALSMKEYLQAKNCQMTTGRKVYLLLSQLLN